MIKTEFKVFKKEKKPKDPLSKNSLIFVCGQTGSGKTSVLLSILNHIQKVIDDLDEAYYFTGSKKDDMLKFLGEDMKKITDPDKFYELLNSIEMEDESPRRLIILDDLISNPLFNLNHNKNFISFLLNHRHNNSTFIISSQGWNILNKQVRSQASLIFCFPPRNESQEKDMLSELPVNKQKLKKAMEIVKNDGDHGFLYINLQKPTAKFFNGFQNEIVF